MTAPIIDVNILWDIPPVEIVCPLDYGELRDRQMGRVPILEGFDRPITFEKRRTISSKTREARLKSAKAQVVSIDAFVRDAITLFWQHFDGVVAWKDKYGCRVEERITQQNYNSGRKNAPFFARMLLIEFVGVVAEDCGKTDFYCAIARALGFHNATVHAAMKRFNALYTTDKYLKETWLKLLKAYNDAINPVASAGLTTPENPSH